MPAADGVHGRGGKWYRQPVLWLGAVVFGAAVAGCAWTVILGMRYHDEPLDAPNTIFAMPLPGSATCPRAEAGNGSAGDSRREVAGAACSRN